MATNNEITFGLVHGSWHGAWCWEFVRDELGKRGYRAVAMDLPIDEASANFNDYADVTVDALSTEREVVLVGHSRAGNVIPRVAGRLAIRKLIFLCSSFEPATTGRPTEAELSQMPARNINGFERGLIPISEGVYDFDTALAKELFYHDCSPDLQDWATSRLRPQRRSTEEPVLNEWPACPQEYILCKDDRVVNPEWSRYVAANWLGIEPIEFSGGHSPFLSRPRELAKLLISLAK